MKRMIRENGWDVYCHCGNMMELMRETDCCRFSEKLFSIEDWWCEECGSFLRATSREDKWNIKEFDIPKKILKELNK